MAVPVKITQDFESAARIVNLLDPVASQEPATKAYVDAAIEGVAWKDSARVRTATNINLASPGATLDGITMATGDRFVAAAQTTAAENGLYVWNGAATPATRSLDASTSAELEQAIVTIEEGTSAGASYRQTSVNFTLGSGAVAWTLFGTSSGAATESSAGIAEIATQAETDTGTDDARFVTPLKLATYAGRKLKHTATIGDGSASSYAVTHNFNTKDVQVYVYETGGSQREALVEKQHASVNAVTIITAAPVAAGALRVVILG